MHTPFPFCFALYLEKAEGLGQQWWGEKIDQAYSTHAGCSSGCMQVRYGWHSEYVSRSYMPSSIPSHHLPRVNSSRGDHTFSTHTPLEACRPFTDYKDMDERWCCIENKHRFLWSGWHRTIRFWSDESKSVLGVSQIDLEVYHSETLPVQTSSHTQRGLSGWWWQMTILIFSRGLCTTYMYGLQIHFIHPSRSQNKWIIRANPRINQSRYLHIWGSSSASVCTSKLPQSWPWDKIDGRRSRPGSDFKVH